MSPPLHLADLTDIALTIAIHSYFAILVTYSVALYLQTGPLNDAEWGMQLFRPDDLWPNYTWIVMIPAALTAGASLPMFFSGLLHIPSLTVLIMLFVCMLTLPCLISNKIARQLWC
jgi:hypothetical protein